MFTDYLITQNMIEKGKRIGKGQFGEVFKGKIPFLTTAVAGKIVKFQKSYGDMKFLGSCF